MKQTKYGASTRNKMTVYCFVCPSLVRPNTHFNYVIIGWKDQSDYRSNSTTISYFLFEQLEYFCCADASFRWSVCVLIVINRRWSHSIQKFFIYFFHCWSNTWSNAVHWNSIPISFDLWLRSIQLQERPSVLTQTKLRIPEQEKKLLSLL